MLTQHKKLMDEAQRLEPSVMVTERNWNAMLKMQHDLFQQQIQLDADLKTLLTRAEAQESLIKMQTSADEFAGQAVPAADAVGFKPENAPNERGRTGDLDRDADECRGIFETGWESEREVFFRLQGADRDYEERPDHNPERYEESAFGYGADGTEEDHHLRVDLDCGSDLVHGVVRLGRAVEQMTDDAPTRDGTTIALHIDSKRRKKLRQKKTALGHAEDDHEDWTMEQHL